MTRFLDRLCTFVTAPDGMSDAVLADARMAIEDTLAVALAGWAEPSAQAVRSAYGAGADPAFGTSGLGPEHEALVQATAAHALDYDDVQLISVTHPSAVSVPALLALAARRPGVRPRVLAAQAIGVAVNLMVGRALGFDHYDRGWHATSTIGPIAATAALAHLLSFDPATIRHAMALAAAQCGGLQCNFGSFAKPVQAGLASAAVVRSALMAEAGVTGAEDVFAPGGYFDLYGDADASARADALVPALDAGLLSRKLFPCCYATHRMIGAALAAHPAVAPVASEVTRITLDVPPGTMRPLRVTDPRDGNEAKFCASYVTAVALAQGAVGLSDFTLEAIRRPEIRALMARIEISEAPADEGETKGLDRGSVALTAVAGNRPVAQEQCAFYPGSPEAPASAAQMEAKIIDCLAIHDGPAPIGLAAFRAGIDALV